MWKQFLMYKSLLRQFLGCNIFQINKIGFVSHFYVLLVTCNITIGQHLNLKKMQKLMLFKKGQGLHTKCIKLQKLIDINAEYFERGPNVKNINVKKDKY